MRALRRILYPLRLLPGSSKSFGPPRGIYTTVEQVPILTLAGNLLPGAEKTVLLPERKGLRTLPVTNSDRVTAKFQRCLKYTVPEANVARLRHARFFGGGFGLIITHDDRILLPYSPLWREGSPQFHNGFVYPLLPRVQQVEKAVVVVTRRAGDNYAHWIRDHLARFWSLREARVDLSDAVLLIPFEGRQYQQATLALLSRTFGFPESRVMAVSHGTHVEAAEMIVPSLANPDLNMNVHGHAPEQLAFIRNLVLGADPGMPGPSHGPWRRIFISRAKARRGSAMEARIAVDLEGLGFASICLEDYSLVEQARIFHDAEVVAGLHGSGFANVLFCEPGTKVIELFPPDYIVTNFWSMCHDLRLQYFAYCEDERLVGYQAYGHAQNADFELSPAGVVEFVAQAAATATGTKPGA